MHAIMQCVAQDVFHLLQLALPSVLRPSLSIHGVQKGMSDSTGLVDFPVRLVNYIGLVKFLGKMLIKFKLPLKYCKRS